MELGLCTWAFARSAAGRRDVHELAAIAADAGFTSLEAAYHPAGAVQTGRPRPPSLAIPIASLATLQLHRFSFAAEKPEQRAAAHDALQGMLDCAAAWAIPSVSFSPGVRSASAPPLAALIDDLAPHVRRAEAHGVDLMIENVPGHCLDTRSGVGAALDAFPGLGLCLDLGNALQDPPVADWWRRFGGRIRKLHISDATLAPRWAPAWPGEGELPWDAVRAWLQERAMSKIFVEVAWDGHTPDRDFVRRIGIGARTLLGSAPA